MKQILIVAVLAIVACSSIVKADSCDGKQDGEHLPYSADCGKFIVCDKQKENLKECVSGLHFSPTELYCMNPKDAGCHTGPTSSTTSTTTPRPGPSSCKGQPLGKRIPLEGVCEKFIVCIGGGVVMECPPPLHFNAKLEVCDWPERAGCPWW